MLELNISCLFGIHKWVRKGHTSFYKTSYGPSKRDISTHLVIYVECEVCKKRAIQGDEKNWKATGELHTGIKLAKVYWVGSRIMAMTNEEMENQKFNIDKSPTNC